ncbi:hypothetical protein SDC9_158164 [bioreactor metagenome]|uniref:Uncharacterized protein n=1 Tax=bioreactor metagenome TaxID=1076179 RepID=A0A645F9F2_9ZZZZ
MTAGLPEPRTAEVGGIDHLIAVGIMLVAPEVLDRLTNTRPHRVPIDQAGTGFLMQTEQIELLAELAVVAFLHILKVLQIEPELLGICPCSAVDAGKHRIGLLATPIGTCNTHQLEGIGLQLLGRLHMRSAAKVGKTALAVQGDLLVLGNRLQQFKLVGLVGKLLLSFGPADHRPDKRLALGDDGLHPLSDLLEVLVHQLPGQIEIIVKAVVNRRADRYLCRGKHLQHCFRHDMRH